MRLRRAPIGLAVLAVLALGGALGLRLFAGGPVGMFPGGALRGEVNTGPVDDLSFAKRALPVTAEDDLGALLAPLIRRQFAMEISGRVTRLRREVDEADIRIYRLEDL